VKHERKRCEATSAAGLTGYPGFPVWPEPHKCQLAKGHRGEHICGTHEMGGLLNRETVACLTAWRRRPYELKPVRVRCWKCGRKGRRLYQKHVGVVDGKRLVPAFGACTKPPVEVHTITGKDGRLIHIRLYACDGVMLRPQDARRVVRAAIRAEQRGYNKVSEYD